MAILEGDIKILKSAVMADTPDGGGAMTGVEVVDGRSNEILPDTSDMDRALGRFAARKLVGAAHTDNTESLLGAHVIITDAPDDPLVHCTLTQTPGWADTRTELKQVVERYLAKGPRLAVNLYDMHYKSSLLVRLISFVGDYFPAGGDGIVLVNQDGTEQFVRVMRPVIKDEKVLVLNKEGEWVVETARVATFEIGSELAYDFPGPPATKGAPAAQFTKVFSTSIAAGANFYGIKALGADAGLGDRSVTTSGGIYSPLVPAATIETPVVDVSPYTRRKATSPTGYARFAMPAASMAIGPGTVLRLPGPVSPKSLNLSLGGIAFAEAGDGVLLQGTAALGTVDYGAGTVTFSASAPVYGVTQVALSYLPATSVDADPHSQGFEVTSANQGRAYVNAFTPLPAPGTFVLDYMTQGRWYQLTDTVNGKLSGAGADNSYGAGTLNYATGSMAVTLGALPDVGSLILVSYGAAANATAFDLATLPTRLSATLFVPWDKPMGTLRWTSGGVAKTATWNEMTGSPMYPASYLPPRAVGNAVMSRITTSPLGQTFSFTPDGIPDGDVTMDVVVATPHSATVITPHTVTKAPKTAFLNNNDGSYTLTDTAAEAMQEGSLSAYLTVQILQPAADYGHWPTLVLYDKGGRVFTEWDAPTGRVTLDIGSINYVTGDMVLADPVPLPLWLRTATEPPPGSAWYTPPTYVNSVGMGAAEHANFTYLSYQVGLPSETTYTSDEVITYTYEAVTPAIALTGWTLKLPQTPTPDAVNGMLFRFNDTLYTTASGLLRAGWDVQTGSPLTANSGTFSADGLMTFDGIPAGVPNVVTWLNLTQNISTGLTTGGVFRTSTAPLKEGVFQLQLDEKIGSANDSGTLSGDFTGTVDTTRGIVRWGSSTGVEPEELTYNAVAIDYLPLSAALLGIETARLPLDGRVPIFRKADLMVVHNTQTYTLPNPLVKGQVYSVGRSRIAAMKVKTATGVTADTTKYTTELDAGTIIFPVDADLTGLVQPFTVEHRIEDFVLCSAADISGKLTLTRSLTHNFPAGSSYVSSALPFGDLFSRAYGPFEQATWTNAWSDTLIGAAPTANFNEVIAPLTTTNRGAIAEQWAFIFTNTTTFRIVGESVGEIGTGNTATDCAPINPATGVPYFTVPALGWGTGWVPGNVYRFNTAACGAPFWTIRTVLQGPATLQDDKFTLAFRTDVDRP